MKIDELIVCPKCNSTKLKVKREATYLYTYTLNQSDAQETNVASNNGKAITHDQPFVSQTAQKVSIEGKDRVHGHSNDTQASEEDFLPFLFDYREQLDNHEYVECEDCHNKFACNISDPNSKIKLTILQKAIRSDFENNPGYLG